MTGLSNLTLLFTDGETEAQPSSQHPLALSEQSLSPLFCDVVMHNICDYTFPSTPAVTEGAAFIKL